MRIVTYGHPALRKVSEPVGEVTEDVLKLGERLVDSLEHSSTPGVGLAAPQIGINRRMVVIDTRPDPQDAADRPAPLSPGEIALEPKMPLVLINPEIVEKSERTSISGEGCLSLPEIYAKVSRPASVTLSARLLDGSEIRVECSHLLGRCLQHEIDHLDGILFLDHANAAEKEAAGIQLRKLERAEKLRSRKKG